MTITYERACDIALSAFHGAVLSDAFAYPDGWVFNVESHGWTEDQSRNEFGASVIVHKADGKWKRFNVGNPEFLDVLDAMDRVALPEKHAATIRRKHGVTQSD